MTTEADYRIVLSEVVERLGNSQGFVEAMDRIAFSEWRQNFADQAAWRTDSDASSSDYEFVYSMPVGSLRVRTYQHRNGDSRCEIFYSGTTLIPRVTWEYAGRSARFGDTFNIGYRSVRFDLSNKIGSGASHYLPKRSSLLSGFISALRVVAGCEESKTGWTIFRNMGSKRKYNPITCVYDPVPFELKDDMIIKSFETLEKTLGLQYLFLKNSGDTVKAARLRLRIEQVARITDEIVKSGAA